MLDLRKRWILEGLALITAGMLAVGWIAWLGLHWGIALQAKAGAHSVLDQFESDAARSFRRGEALARAVQIRLADTDLDRLPANTLLELAPFLEREGPVSSLMVYERAGRILFLNRSLQGWSLSLHRWDRGDLESFRGEGDRWRASSDKRFIRAYRPAERPWHAWAQAHEAPSWMPAPYRFPDGLTAGYSYVIPLRPGGPGTPVQAVIAADIALDPYTRDLWSQHRRHYRNLVALTPDDKVIIPAWRADLEADNQALRAAILAPFPRPPQRVLLERRAESPGLPGARLLLLEPPGGLPVPPWATALFIGLPVLLTGAVLGSFVWRHHRRVVAPLADLADSTRERRRVANTPSGSHRLKELEALDTRLSEARSAEEGHQSLRQQLEGMQRADTVRALAPGIVHDANNQLAVAMGQLAMVSDLLQDHPELEPHLQKARGAALRCSEVLRALLAYSRPQPGAQECLDLGTIARETSDTLQRLLGSAIKIRLEAASAPVPVWGERVKLEQVIVNLSLNARDAMPQGGSLILRTCLRNSEAVLEVEDSGTGMPPSVRERLFEPFFTTKAPGKGTGLGLAMVASIVEGMGGRITVTSTEGVGTTFGLAFPPSTAAPQEDPPEAQGPRG